MPDDMHPSRDETQLYGRDLKPGLSFRGNERTIVQEDFATFAQLTGDSHPIHYDEVYAASSPFGRPVAHGLLLVGLCALGATSFSSRLRDSMIAFVEQSAHFRRPVFVGDTIVPLFKLEGVRPASDKLRAMVHFDVTLMKADNLICLEAHHRYLLWWSPAGRTDKS